jgi:ATP synthase protein I
VADQDRRIVRGAALAAAAVAVVVTAAAAVLGGWPAALGAVLGTALAIAFFGITVVVVSWAGRISDELLLPAALGTYAAKVVGIGALLLALDGTTAFDRTAFALAVVIAACVFLVAEVRLAITTRIPYVDDDRGEQG